MQAERNQVHSIAEAQPVLAILIAKLQTTSKTDVSLAEKYVSNLEKLYFAVLGRRHAVGAAE